MGSTLSGEMRMGTHVRHEMEMVILLEEHLGK